MTSIGKITQVISAVVDVEFENGKLPAIYNALECENNGKKLIYNDTPGTWEFYDLIKDPKETQNIYDESLEEVSRMKNRLLHYFDVLGIKTKLTK